ncbi:MAG: DUF4197 domain-containing protein [Gammaproteobacteria bacterium]
MHKVLVLFIFLMVPVFVAALSLDDISSADAAGGLREALLQGAGNAVSLLGRTDGYFKNPRVKIPLPKNLAKAEKLMRLAGLGKQADELIVTMNRAAEAAVPEAKSLLVGAVQKMTVTDAKNILTGGDDSVTKFFKEKTVVDLTEKFLPVVHKHTEKLLLAQKYNEYAAAGARLGLVEEKNADINRYVTRKALNGLYKVIADEEHAIRANPLGATGSLARKVFGALGQ